MREAKSIVEVTSLAKKRRRRRVWVVMHYEILANRQIDSMQFHVSSSLRAAEKYMNTVRVEPFSWWQVHPHFIDHDLSLDGWEGNEVHFYSHTGRPLKSAPISNAMRAWEKHARKNPGWTG